jgi:serine/threonine protein kinase
VKIPRTLGRYEVVDLIGRGGMGALYRARDPRIGRYVAIKQLRRDFDTPELRDRFSREAAAAGSLSHPNIVTIFDVGEEDGLPFIAMEYVRGETFADVLGLRPPLSVSRKLQLVEEVCAGLAHAHESGIVHRDIKPANLILGAEGTVKILDFGIAKLSASGITLPGVILGTLNYMAPEQIRGEAVDARADVFAVGAVLYELLTHRQAFPGNASVEVLDRILNGAPKPIAESCPDVDPRLVDLVQFALEKDPDQRIQEITSFQKELANIRTRPAAEEPQRSSTRRASASGRQTGLVTPPPSPVSRGSTDSSDRDRATRRAQIDEYLNAAAREFDAGHYDAAIESCKQVLMLDDSDERAIAQLDRIHAAFDEQQALAELAAREEEAEANRRDSVERARRRFYEGGHQEALDALEDLDPASHPSVAAAVDELRSAFREIEEERRASRERAEQRQRFADALGRGRAALQHEDLDAAARLLDVLREIDAHAPELSDFEERWRRAQAAARLKAEVDVILLDFDRTLAAGDLDRAGDLVNTAALRAPNDPRLEAMRKRRDEAVAAQAAREAAEAQAREAEQQLDAALADFERDDLDAAAGKLKIAIGLAPQLPRIDEFSGRLREALDRRAAAEAAARLAQEVAGLIAGASQRMEAAGDQSSELQLALRDVDHALSLDPGSAAARSVKAAIEKTIAAHREAARVKAVVNNARTRFANGKRQAAIRLLEEFQPASHPDVAAALGDLRAALQKLEEEQRVEQERIRKQEQLAAIFGQAQTAIREHRFEAALEQLAAAAEIEPASEELRRLHRHVEDEQAAVRIAAEVDAALVAFDERFSAGDMIAAAGLLTTAAALAAGDQRVAAARQRLDQTMAARDAEEARTRALESRRAEVEKLFDQGDLDGSLRLIKAAQSDGGDQEQMALLYERVVQAIQQKEEAEAIVKRRQRIEDLVARAAERLQATEHKAGDLAAAARDIDEVLAADPDHAAALELKAAAQVALAAEQQAAVVRASIRNARTRFANGKHQAALQLLEKLDPASPGVQETLQELRAALHDIEEKRRAEQERADKQRQLATHLGTARAAIKAARFADALDALSAARSIDDAAEGLAELTGQATRGQAGAPPESLRVEDDATAADEDATRFITIDPENDPRRPMPAGPPAARPAANDHGGENDTATTPPPVVPAADAGSRQRSWLWVAVAVGLVAILLILIALFRSSRPARVGTYSVPIAVPAEHRVVDAGDAVPSHGASDRLDRHRRTVRWRRG